MRRVTRTLRRVALSMTLCACASQADGPASSGATPERRTAPAAAEWTGARQPMATTASDGANPGPQGGWVLHVGDSFVHASLWQNLRPRFRALGTEYVVEAETATYTTTWAASPELEKWLARRPSLVLVTLGANEADMPAPEEHARAIEVVSRKIAGASASCVWIAPPMWKRDTGILEVIHRHCAPCLFFDSDAVLGGLSAEERQPDGIHPNKRGGERWARAFWEWLGDHRDMGSGPWALVPFERRGS
jgi:lysophospholipase L1-like esterase